MSSTIMVRSLRDVGLTNAPEVGGKAANLGELMSMGLRVPDGVVLTNVENGLSTESLELLGAAVTRLGDGPFAVRSSAIAEDGAQRSFAGIFSSVLNVRADDVAAAVDHVVASGDTAQVAEYEATAGANMAVIVQRMIRPTASGVALTADPIDRNRQTCVITATPGTGDRLVSGEVMGDEWIVDSDGTAHERRRVDGAAEQKSIELIARTARRVAQVRGTPQDIEWAIDAEERLWIVQARPMTALPPEVSWDPPDTGAYSRTFRLGEWLSGPVTPLFETWLLPAIEEKLHSTLERWVGLRSPRPYHVVINGWAFFSLNWLSPRASLASLPGVLLRFVRNPRRVLGVRPETARFGVQLYEKEWREELLPAYRGAVAQASHRVEQLPVAELPALIDNLGARAGEYFASIAALSGMTYKLEMNLAQAYHRDVDASANTSYLPLLAGFVSPTDVPVHAVTSLDWFHRPLPLASTAEMADHQRVVATREAAERAAFDILASNPRRLARFKRILTEAQRLVPIREEQVAELTLPWPVLRRAVARIAERLLEQNIVATTDDIYFLTRDEVLRALGGAAVAVDIESRRALLDEQARLAPPMMAGALHPIASRMWASYTASIGGTPSTTAIVSGGPASPGRATGLVRVITRPEDFDQLEPDEILVAPVTAPAWTPLFNRAAAVVTDVGSVAAHASIIAREYGIPAIVGCGDATSRLKTGMRVTVDGNTGNVEPA